MWKCSMKKLSNLNHDEEALESLLGLGALSTRKNYYSQLQEKVSQLEKISDAKSVFLSNISHEMRTPLNVILGMASILKDSNLTESNLKCLQLIENAGNNLLDLINDVLDLSKIEAGAMNVDPIDFSISELVHEIHQLFIPLSLTSKTELSLDIDPQIVDVVYGDRKKIRQILINLVGNAVKFTNKGKVNLKVFGRDIVEFVISDTGIGISKENFDRIFRPFEQSDSSITRKFGGTGLGLTIVKKNVELLGGEITLDSKENLGTVFKVKLPLKAGTIERTHSEITSADYQLTAKARVLIVEDSEDNCTILKSLLNGRTKEIHVAENGKEALLKQKELLCDVILMDIQMPVMDGYTATKEIRKFEVESKRSPSVIIAQTAHAFSEAVDSCLKSGCSAHLSKPISKKILLEKIESLLRERA